MPVEHGFRPRPVGLPNFSSDRGGGSSGTPPGDKPFQLLPGKTPLGEPIGKRQLGAERQTEQTQPGLREEINAYLEKRAQLRAEGLWLPPEDEPPIITPADAISFDLHELLFSLRKPQTDEQQAKYDNLNKVTWAFDALSIERMSQPMQQHVTNGCEFGQGFLRNHPWVLEEKGRLNGGQTIILAEQLHKVGVPFEPRPQGITIPFALTVAKMREIAGGEPLWEIPPPNLTHIQNHRRNR